MTAANAWSIGEPVASDERRRTSFAEPGWHAWNGKSPELEFCEWIRALVMLERPRFVIETGVGQGYVTRRILSTLPEGSTYRGFESDDEWRARLLRIEAIAHRIDPLPTPSWEQMALCDLLVGDSTLRRRLAEIRLWRDTAPAGSLLVLHDVSERHPDGTVHRALAREVRELEAEIGPGSWTPNPRGGWIGRKGA